jgi:hypothetical protein
LEEDTEDSEDGIELDDHFQPGTLQGSSSRERIVWVAGFEGAEEEGKRRRVIEKPGMLRLVYYAVSMQYNMCDWYPLNIDMPCIQSSPRLCNDPAKFKFTQST